MTDRRTLAGMAALVRARSALDTQDARGKPYMVPYNVPGVPMDYYMARAIAESEHPSRVLANTLVYRYGRFILAEGDEPGWPDVRVVMMTSHIATFTRDHVQFWSRGHVTTSTTEALGNLASIGVWFYTDKGKIYWEDFTENRGNSRVPHEFTEGAFFPFRRPR